MNMERRFPMSRSLKIMAESGALIVTPGHPSPWSLDVTYNRVASLTLTGAHRVATRGLGIVPAAGGGHCRRARGFGFLAFCKPGAPPRYCNTSLHVYGGLTRGRNICGNVLHKIGKNIKC